MSWTRVDLGYSDLKSTPCIFDLWYFMIDLAYIWKHLSLCSLRFHQDVRSLTGNLEYSKTHLSKLNTHYRASKYFLTGNLFWRLKLQLEQCHSSPGVQDNYLRLPSVCRFSLDASCRPQTFRINDFTIAVRTYI